MWSLVPLPPDRWRVLRDGAPVEQGQWLRALADDAHARSSLTEVLRAAPFGAFLWETPPVGRMAELALIDSPRLARARPDPSAFQKHFGEGAVATFANLSGDSVLVAPNPSHAPDATHLAAFVRRAPAEVIDALWTAVGTAVLAWRGPLWVSTSGLAVPWLHVRLDRSPKYYSYVAYRN